MARPVIVYESQSRHVVDVPDQGDSRKQEPESCTANLTFDLSHAQTTVTSIKQVI